MAESDEAIMRQMYGIQEEVSKQPLIGQRSPTQQLLDIVTEPTMHRKLETLKETHPHFRAARGDGNCFYRAFAFGLMEYLCSSPAKLDSFLDSFNQCFELAMAAKYDRFTTEDFFDTTRELFERLRQDGGLEAAYEAMSDEGTSNYVVATLRLITSAYMKTHEDVFQPFLENMGVADYCSKNVDPFGVECEELQIRALTTALHAGVRICYLDRSAGEKVNFHDIVADGDQICCQLLYRPGHYDLIYEAHQGTAEPR